MNIVLFIFYIFFKYVLLKIVRSIPTSIKNYFKILFKVVFYPIICSFHILEKGNLNQIGKMLKIWCIFSIFLFYIFGYLMMPEHAVTSGYFAFALLLIAPSIKPELLTRKKKEIIFSAFKTHIVGSIMIIAMTFLKQPQFHLK